MAATATITQIVYNNDGGKIRIRFDSGIEWERDTLEEMRQSINDIETPEVAQRFAIARWLKGNHDGANPNTIIGRTVTVDLAAPQPVSVSGGG